MNNSRQHLFRTLLYYDQGDILIVVTESLVVGQFRVEGDGSLVEVSKVKMSTRSADCSISWAGRVLSESLKSRASSRRSLQAMIEINSLRVCPSFAAFWLAVLILCLQFFHFA